MTQDLPAPSPSGYQPSPGEGITHIDVEVRPSRQYQTVGMTARLTFPEPRTYSEALPAIEDLTAALEEQASAQIDKLAAVRDSGTAAGGQPSGQAPQPSPSGAAPAPAAAPQQQAMPAGQFAAQLGGTEIGGTTPQGLQWAVAQKPQDRGSFKYVTTASVDTNAFREQAKQAVAQLGVDPASVTIFDDRTGKYGVESGNNAYSAGKAKAAQDSQLKQMLGQRDIVAYLDFNSDGSVKASLTKDAKAAVQAIQMMRQAQQQPEQAPHPADSDVPF